MRFLFVMDDIRKINYKKDSTLAMMWAVQDKGHKLAYCQITDLYLAAGKAYADCATVTVARQPDDFYQMTDDATVALSDFDVIMMRKDPPFDMRFVYATYMLDFAARDGVLVVNRPNSLRDCNEKLFATQFSELMTPTLVTSQQHRIKAFVQEHQDVIVKPLDGMGGAGIFRLTTDSPNIGATLELLTEQQTLPIMAQRYIPEISQGDKRILMINGEPVDYCLARIPSQGETRGNLAAGGRGVAQPLSNSDRAIAKKIAPALKEKGLIFVGLDVIGDYVTEINVTSPTCIREIDNQIGTDIAGDLIDTVISMVSQ